MSDTENQSEEVLDENQNVETEASCENNEEPQTQKAEEEENLSSELKKIAELEAKVESLEKENADLKDQVLRRAADFENYRKRAIQEKQDAYDYANTSLLKDLLESLDNFDRTVEAAANAPDAKTIAEGVTMINKSLISMLETKYNLASYGTAGDAFNPDIHEAIGKVEEDVAEPVLKAVYLKGYKLKERVIRHAKVMVSMPKE